MMARWFVVAWGALFMCLGFWVLIQPRGLVEFADLFLTSTGLWVAVVLRLVVGVLLWTSAGVSRTPRVLKVLGALFVFSAFALPVVGLERMRRIADWGAGLDDPVLRAVSLLVIGLGGFIAWSVLPRRSEP
jgi:hypothetical protein